MFFTEAQSPVMAVYTQLSKSEIEDFLSGYNAGSLTSFKGIAEGVSNTNYLLTVSSSSAPSNTNYILTMFEENFDTIDLPFILDFTEHLAKKGIICPSPIKNKRGEVISKIKEKTAILVEFLQGRGNPHITTRHTELLGELLAKLHLAAGDFKEQRKNPLSLNGLNAIFSKIGKRVDEIQSGLYEKIESEFAYLEQNLPKELPSGVVHTDIFPDNVFFIDGNTDQPELSGIIDFYFSCTDFFVYDLMIAINAWCFDATDNFVPDRAKALVDSYNEIRPLTPAEKDAMPILGRLAAMRFLLTRCDAWLNRADGALVNIKDPLEYLNKLTFHTKRS